METAIPRAIFAAAAIVLTVPMRNGNEHEHPIGKAVAISSYRTYEEWKPSFKKNTLTEYKRVLTVPMRNGN